MSDALQSFAQTLLDPAQPCPPVLRAWNGSDPTQRLAVYRNNVVSSLVRALADTFPVVRELVGPEFFDAMAALFVRAHPPCSPVLTDYGDDFPGFVADFEPARHLGYLADVARLERARVQAYHAADAEAISAGAIAERLAAPDDLPQARLRLHPSLAVLRSPHAIVSLWAAHQGLGEISQVDPNRAECALVLRADDDAAVLQIDATTACFVQHLADGATLAEAAEAASDAAADAAFDLGASLGLLIRHGAIVDWITEGRIEP